MLKKTRRILSSLSCRPFEIARAMLILENIDAALDEGGRQSPSTIQRLTGCCRVLFFKNLGGAQTCEERSLKPICSTRVCYNYGPTTRVNRLATSMRTQRFISIYSKIYTIGPESFGLAICGAEIWNISRHGTIFQY
ncbi:hypothetical protein FB556_0150 [Enteractinococcus coprophilus]|uniref:Uncharacterized protein n=1 Tax=Enteractinococcus coprophilus TaxID=1027633 RepID=A0A543AM96_9MICC|nr:hypothetical protein FB556_0150 [Enteractinococcus coprophilus]